MYFFLGYIKILFVLLIFVGLVFFWLFLFFVFVGEVGLCFCLIVVKLFGCIEVIVIDGIFGDDGRFNLFLGMNFFGLMLYVF